MVVKVKINNKEYFFDDAYTIMQACDMLGIEIPRLCYNKNLSISGNCRMCLVELAGSPRLVASCATNIYECAEIITDSEKVIKARKDVMSFLLANHPLDCPICDQAGECDLQDEAFLYGAKKGAFKECKKTVEEKFLGPMIETHMNRCIMCSKCIRLEQEVLGSWDLGILNRGNKSEIFCSNPFGMTSNMAGNVIDVCPVGAINNAPYAYKVRPWNSKSCNSIDIHDSTGSNIRFDYYENKITRVVPVESDINESWITDRVRFSFDGIRAQRLDSAYIKKSNFFEKIPMQLAIKEASEMIMRTDPSKIAIISGGMVSCETQMLMKKMSEKLKISNIDCRYDGSRFNTLDRKYYIFNSKMKSVSDVDFCILIGVDICFDAPILGSKLYRSWVENNCTIANLGQPVDTPFKTLELGNDPRVLLEILEGSHEVVKLISRAQRPMLIIGHDIFLREDSDFILKLSLEIAKNFGFITDIWNGFNVLPKYASFVGGLDLSILPSEGGMNAGEIIKHSDQFDIIYLIGSDEVPMLNIRSKYVIYQGHHGDLGAHRADLILPSNFYTEQKYSTYVNLEGRPQMTRGFLNSCGDALDDWRIICNLLSYIGYGSEFNDIASVQRSMGNFNKNLRVGGDIYEQSDKWPDIDCKEQFMLEPISLDKKRDFYMSDSICRCSKNMAECSINRNKQRKINIGY